MKLPVDVYVRRLLRRFGFDIERRRPALPDLLRRQRVDTVLDVGANVGQYATRLRAWGYRGRIVSFEPVQTAFLALERTAARDPGWKVLNLALGDADRSGTIHVAQASVFSSILKAGPELRARHYSAAPIAEEEITIRRLDSVFEKVRGSGQAFFLKVDAQGYEREVLRGATDTLHRVRGVQVEVPLRPTYEGEATLEELVHELDVRGFVIALIEPVSHDHAASSLLQVDCIFVKRDAGIGNADSPAV